MGAGVLLLLGLATGDLCPARRNPGEIAGGRDLLLGGGSFYSLTNSGIVYSHDVVCEEFLF
jgi:hypothetical protein